jgi:hypothetical protein
MPVKAVEAYNEIDDARKSVRSDFSRGSALTGSVVIKPGS